MVCSKMLLIYAAPQPIIITKVRVLTVVVLIPDSFVLSIQPTLVDDCIRIRENNVNIR